MPTTKTKPAPAPEKEPTIFEKEGRVTLYLGPDLKSKACEAAREAGESLNRWVKMAVRRRYATQRDARKKALRKQEETR